MSNPLFICIHGHFYQPPRENPWLDEVELQRSAYPYQNWNERITAECYAPNMAARLFNEKGRIVGITNNYSRISFNFGPTLLRWIEKNDRKVYEAILSADHEGRSRFSGHGPAMAQGYNHMILPLANSRDRITQVRWGIEDFRYRFRRQPEGMWLPETAVDLETLEVMSDEGIIFTVLAPGQASRVLSPESSRWSSVSGGKIDTSVPYVCKLPSGNSICLFFYDGEISQEIAFRKLLSSGERFADRLISSGTHGTRPVLVSVATDGETYGHHHKFGEMGLAYALRAIEAEPEARLTIFGEFLDSHPPLDEVEILENTSWSCVHGIGRWKEDCGCCTGMNPSWDQRWRGPLRQAMDWLRDRIEPVFESVLSSKGLEPWDRRDKYISLILDREKVELNDLFATHIGSNIGEAERVEVLKALEMQHKAMLMFTSCGWFFDDVSGIEPIQILRYASQVIEYAKELAGLELETEFLAFLEKAKSNDPKWDNGKNVYLQSVGNIAFDLERMAAHFGVMMLFEEDWETIRTYCYRVSPIKMKCLGSGTYRLCYGSIDVSSRITLEKGLFSFSAIGLGGHNVVCAVSDKLDDNDFDTMVQELEKTYEQGDVSSMIQVLDKYFGSHQYDLTHVFSRDQQQVINSILSSDMARIDTFLREILEDDYLVMNFISKIDMPVPSQFLKSAEVIIHSDILMELSKERPDMQKLRENIKTAERWGIPLETSNLVLQSRSWLDRTMDRLLLEPGNMEILGTIKGFLNFMKEYLWELNPWHSQNVFFEILEKVRSGKVPGAQSEEWEKSFLEIGEFLDISY